MRVRVYETVAVWVQRARLLPAAGRRYVIEEYTTEGAVRAWGSLEAHALAEVLWPALPRTVEPLRVLVPFLEHITLRPDAHAPTHKGDPHDPTAHDPATA